MSVMVTEGMSDLGPGSGPRAVRQTLRFETSPPGLTGLHEFELAPLDDIGYLFALRSTEQPGVRLFVVPPRPYFPEYAPRLDPSVAESLELADGEAVLLVVVHPGRDGGAPTANLLAPVVVNPRTGSAVQILLDAADWPLRAPLTAAETAA